MTTQDFNFFLPIAKVEKNKDGTCTVSGYASTPSIDLDGEIVSLDAVRKALPGYWEYRNIREMHQPKAVGVGKEANIDGNGLFLTSRIVDKEAVQKCLEEVYKGYSIGGRKLNKVGNEITEIELIEISLVDRPANPDCRISVAKRAKEGQQTGAYLVKVVKSRDPRDKALAKMAQTVNLLSKAGPPAARDGFSLPAPGPNRSPKDPELQNNKSAGACEDHGVVGCKDCIDKAKKAKKEAKKAKKLAKREAEKKRLEKLTKLLPVLGKRMSTAGSLSYAFDSIRDSQRSLILEAEREGGDKKDAALAKELGKISYDLGQVISQKALHESEESLDLSDCDDEYIRNLLENTSMDKLAASNGSDPGLDTAILNLIKRSVQPSREQRVSTARGNLDKVRKARKAAAEEIKNCHAAISKRFMAKMAKAAKDKKEEDDDEMAETEKVLKSLTKAYSALTTMKTFIKAADSHLEKAASRSGQRGQEVSDPSSSGEPTGAPAGLRDLSPVAMASAGGGGQPPMYPTDGGVYPGKFAKYADKNGMVPANIAELIAEKSALEGQVGLLSKVSNRDRGPGPYAFDMSKIYGGEAANSDGTLFNRQQKDILLEGVNAAALDSPDEHVRHKAAATVVGNYLLNGSFGKSIVDPSFRGKAGMGR